MKKKIVLLVVLFPLILAFCSGGNEKTEKEEEVQFILNKKPLWEGKKEIKIKKLIQIGEDDIKRMDYLFGFITDIAVDNDDNVYVLDHTNNKVSQYTPEGEFLSYFGKGRGQGPGEFSNMHNVCIDFDGNVFITDADKRIVSTFDSLGEHINEYKLKESISPLHDIVAFNKYIFVGVRASSYASKSKWDGDLFQIYSLPGFKFVGSIGSAVWIKKNKNYRNITGGNSMAVNKKANELILSHTYPYLIEIFDDNFKLKRKFGKDDPMFDKYYEEPGLPPGMKIMRGASIGGVYLQPDEIIMNGIRHLTKRENKDNVMDVNTYFDFFNTSGQYLMTIPKSRFESVGKYNLIMESDSKGHIWMSHIEPYPHIIKYEISFVDKMN